MAIPTTCPGCQAYYLLTDTLAGKKVRCKGCGEAINVGAVTPPGKPANAQVTRTPGIPTKSNPLPTESPEQAANNALNAAAALPRKELPPLPTVKRGFPVVFLLVLVLVLGVLLAGIGAAGGFAWYLYSTSSPAPTIAQPKPEKVDGEQKKEQEKKGPAEEFNITEVRKSVVYIKRLNGVGTTASSGTGFFITADGLLYTNRHVIQGAGPTPDFNAPLLVGVPSRKDPNVLEYFKAAVVYVPPQTDSLDFAILKITARPDYGDFPTLPLATDKPGLGAAVAAVGYPGINDIDRPTLSFNKGAISAAAPVQFEKKSFYQTDAAINPGNSGGPLVNARGEVVAIVTLKKPGANNMSYALVLSEIEAVARPKPEQLARAKPEAGPVDLKALPQATTIAPRGENWNVNQGRVVEKNRYMTVENNGGVFWITTREDLPENFQLSAEVGVEFFQGNQRLQQSQRSILRTLLVRFAAADANKNILENGPGYQIKFSHKFLQLNRDNQNLLTEQVGNPDEPFILTVVRHNGEITVLVDDQVVMRHIDANPPAGRAKLSIGGYLSRLYLGDVKILAIDGNGPGGPILVKKDPKKDPIDVPKGKIPGEDQPPNPPEKPQANERALAGTASSLCQGGGGRYLILHLAKERKLAIYDATVDKVVKYLPVTEDNVKFAAGQDKLFVVLPTANVIQRYSLTTFEKETTIPAPLQNTEVALTGSAAQGPLLLASGGTTMLVDTMTFKPLPTKMPGCFSAAWRPRVSGDGRLFATYLPDSSPQQHQWFLLQADNTLKGGGFERKDNIEINGHAAPSPDGRYIFSAKGVFTADGKPIGALHNDNLYTVAPAEGGTFYLNFTLGTANLTLHLVGDETPLATLDVEKMPDVNSWDREKLTNDQRYFFVPSAKLLVYLPPAGDRLIVYKVDVEQLLAKSNRDYLVATGKPPASAARGAMYSFALGVLSKKGNVKYKVEAGPKGMAVAADGKLTWAVPNDFADADADVIVTVSDASGREIFVNFKVVVTGDVVAVKPPDKGPGDNPPDKPVVPGDLSIKVAPLKADKEERQLPAPVESVCVGGGGRFLFFSLNKERKIAVFDVNEAKIVKYLPVSEDNVKIAACQDKLIVVLPTANMIQRYSLTTFERELTTQVPEGQSVGVALMGSASHGPLVLCGAKGALAVDPYTLKALPDIKLGNFQGVVRMSADGRVVTSYVPTSSPQQHVVFVRVGDTYKPRGLDNEAAGMMTPGPEGRFVYTARGIYTSEGQPSGKRGSYNDGSRYSLPSAEGESFYLRINVPGYPHGGGGPGQLYIHLSGDDTELSGIDALVPAGINTWGREAFGVDQHFYLVPSAHLLVVISPNRNQLLIYRVDIDKLLEKSNHDYLLILSRPPVSAERGSKFAYTPLIKAKKGGVKVKLESGPTGMKVAADGQVTWDVPKDFADKEVEVSLTVSDAGNQDKFHNFRLAIQGKTEPGPKGPPPDKTPMVTPPDKPVVPGDHDIKVAPLKENREERMLPSPVSDVCVGGGGRYLVLHLARDRKLAIFDVNEAKVVKYIALTEDEVKFAAGKDKLFVYNPKAEVLLRYSLTTFEKETTVTPSGTGTVCCLAMGSASTTPLLLGRTSGAVFLDSATLKEVVYEREKGTPGLAFREDGSLQVRISADGRLITSWALTVSPTGLWAWRIEGKTLKGVYKNESAGTLVPSADGSTIFAPGQLYAADAAPLGKQISGGEIGVWYVPAAQGRYYLSLSQREQGIAVSLHLLGHDRPLVALSGVDGFGGFVDWRSKQTATIDKQVHYIPDARLLVVLSPAKDKLVLHRVDVDALVEKSGIDYLFVTSVPPAHFVPGQSLTYAPVVKSKKGSVKVKVDVGPMGMTVSPSNELTWKVPKDFTDAETTVTLTISDATGQEISHTFRLTKDQHPDK